MITTDVTDGVALLTIDRSHVLNALDAATLHELADTFAELDARSDVAVIILTGAGERAFSVGGDLAEMAEPRGVAEALRLPMQRVLDDIARSSTPTIAAVNGYALGGGLELALACDIRIAGERATFALPELTWSLLPAAGGITRLTRLVGAGRALEMILTGRTVRADEALSVGIVSSVVRDADLLDVARATAETVATKAPIAVRVARMTVRVAAQSDSDTALLAESLALAAIHGTADRAEGTSSFVEKRPARFEGR